MFVGVVGALALVTVGLDAWATMIVVRNEPDAGRRRLQLVLVWVLPIIGSLLAGLAHAKRKPILADPTAWPNTNDSDARNHASDRSHGVDPHL